MEKLCFNTSNNISEANCVYLVAGEWGEVESESQEQDEKSNLG